MWSWLFFLSGVDIAVFKISGLSQAYSEHESAGFFLGVERNASLIIFSHDDCSIALRAADSLTRPKPLHYSPEKMIVIIGHCLIAECLLLLSRKLCFLHFFDARPND